MFIFCKCFWEICSELNIFCGIMFVWVFVFSLNVIGILLIVIDFVYGSFLWILFIFIVLRYRFFFVFFSECIFDLDLVL